VLVGARAFETERRRLLLKLRRLVGVEVRGDTGSKRLTMSVHKSSARWKCGGEVVDVSVDNLGCCWDRRGGFVAGSLGVSCLSSVIQCKGPFLLWFGDTSSKLSGRRDFEVLGGWFLRLSSWGPSASLFVLFHCSIFSP
jgi:hypothetical protein